MLYVRMLFNIFIVFFTSRIILKALGVVDYGIYNVVGGVVSLFVFLNTSLSGATSRFLTYELGLNNLLQLKKTFRAALTVHVCLAIMILLLCETIGLWFVMNKLTIPAERLNAALVVYQFSIATCILNITQVPYNATIIAHERMQAFAYIGIADSILKLIIVYLLYISQYDRLIMYSILFFSVTLLTTLIYRCYCTKTFMEVEFRLTSDTKILKPMLVYSGWDLYGNMSVMVRSQGVNILLNTFFGPTINAASAISNQVMAGIMGFADNFLTAVRPQIVKQYANKRINELKKLIISSSKYSFCLLFILSLPLLLEMEFILSIWLDKFPVYAVLFCQLSIINNWVSIIFRPITYSIQSTGKMKRISFINGTVYIMVLPISYFVLKIIDSPTVPFVLNIILLIIGSVISLYTLKLYINQFNIRAFICKVILVAMKIVLLTIPIPYLIHSTLDYGWARFFYVCISSFILSILIIYTTALNSHERSFLKDKLKKIINKNHD